MRVSRISAVDRLQRLLSVHLRHRPGGHPHEGRMFAPAVRVARTPSRATPWALGGTWSVRPGRPGDVGILRFTGFQARRSPPRKCSGSARLNGEPEPVKIRGEAVIVLKPPFRSGIGGRAPVRNGTRREIATGLGPESEPTERSPAASGGECLPKKARQKGQCCRQAKRQ
jgi:hypothetical protein